jgi:predicted metal-dependent HD superfamily phosphohydrolase
MIIEGQVQDALYHLRRTNITQASAELLVRHAASNYDEPHRHYHTFAHAVKVLQVSSHLGQKWLLQGVGSDEYLALLIAALWHDAVYDPKATGGLNELLSAIRATEACRKAGVSDMVTVLVHRLILETVEHKVEVKIGEPYTIAAACLIDADLHGFAADWRDFQRQNENIRKEYAHVTDDQWKAGRPAVLEKYLWRDPIFYFLFGGAEGDSQATNNLVRAIKEARR